MPDYRYRKWTPLLFPSEEIDDGPNITVLGQVFRDIQEHSQTDRDNEVGGFLLGNIWSAGQDAPVVQIDSAIRAAHTNATSTRLEFTSDTWTAFHQEREARFSGKEILGWYHTHPGHGIFLSSYDTFIHENFYANPQQVALVVDPIRLESGFFKWTSNGLDSHRYYGFHELGTSDDQSFNPGGNLSQDLPVGPQTGLPTEPEVPDILELPHWLSWIDKLPGLSLIMKSVESSISRGLTLFSLMAFVALVVFVIFGSLVLGRLSDLTEAQGIGATGSNADRSSGVITRTIPSMGVGKPRSVTFSSDSGFLAGLRQIEISPRLSIDDEFEISVQNLLSNPRLGSDKAFKGHNVYGFLEVLTPGFLPRDIKGVSFQFVVPYSWLEMYNIDPEEIRLWRFDGDWLASSPVNTSPSGNDSLAVTFTPNHLSYFALSGRTDSSEVSQRTSALTLALTSPPTAVPPTAVPPTAVSPTAVSPTAVPPTAVSPTAVPPTAVPPTAVPPTAVPPTAVPPTCEQPDITQGVTGSSTAGSVLTACD
ncbi:Mov34/MPN/PAD-1 family protein [Dehalococcoidia bacterium]|nr:Mov34/MPN/PAD-1 family protein [Dehalococcoidia bacterium]